MTRTHDEDRTELERVSTSIKELSLYLDDREAQGRALTAAEIHDFATKLQAYVEALLAASKNLRNV